jgi:polyisoprenoid-binding protein YceI
MNKWQIDPVHSEIKFKVRHLLISSVTGQFKKFDATVESDKDDFSDAKISFEAEVDSIDTGTEMRDNHLRTNDFFDAANYPKITFVSDSLVKKSGDEYELTGDFTIRGVTKKLKLDVTYNGRAKGLDGSDVAGFEMTGKINRQDFGVKWNTLTETGGIALGDEVKLDIAVEMKKQVAGNKIAA